MLGFSQETTPLKLDMEPENVGREIPFQNHRFQIPFETLVVINWLAPLSSWELSYILSRHFWVDDFAAIPGSQVGYKWPLPGWKNRRMWQTPTDPGLCRRSSFVLTQGHGFSGFFCSWWYSQFCSSFAVFTCRRCVQTWLVCQPGSIAASHVWCFCHTMTSWLPRTRLRPLPGRWDKFDVCCISGRLLLRWDRKSVV